MKTGKYDTAAERLTREQREVALECGTEPPFRNAYWNEHRKGVYVDILSGIPLFSSADKFDSGSGWPSFSRAISDSAVSERGDSSHGMNRIEVRGAASDSHLGHLFPDGPGPDGLRFCINSASLRFVSLEEMGNEGYRPWMGLVEGGQSLGRAMLAAGCFWGTEAYFRALPGVISTQVGYSGGTKARPTYREVCSGGTGHAETLYLEFDESRIAYRDLLRHFLRMHDPTQVGGQGNDRGSQYRSAIFFFTGEQSEIARGLIGEQTASGRYRSPLVTEIEPAGPFWPAEEYHQDYLGKNPGGYCHVDLGLLSKPLG